MTRWLVVCALSLLLGCASTGVGTGLAHDDDDALPLVSVPASAGWEAGAIAWTGPRTPTDDDLWAYTDPGELPEVRDASGHRLPLRHTRVRASLQGHFAEVTVTQLFRNDADDVVEAIYAFPLPENAAVTNMRMLIGPRIIESKVLKRAEARQAYSRARAAGYMSALLEQERPNVFTQSIANIPPAEEVEIELRYLQTLTWDAGEYEFVFPMVVGPRYVPGAPLARRPGGSGTKQDTDRVPDASRISPAVIGHGMRRGDDIMIEVEVWTGQPITTWRVPTHAVAAHVNDGRLALRLAEADELPNRDFVLRYRVADETPRATLLLGSPTYGDTGRYALIVQPPHLDVDTLVGRREMIYVIDRSGSMAGEPLALAKEVVREALARLRPVDTFDIVGFESGTERLFGAPRPANAANVALALRFIDGLQAGGGTNMENAVEAALQDDVAKGYVRYVLFVTDGYIAHESEIFAGAQRLVSRLARRGRRARVFAAGVGSAPNRHLVTGLARAGHGLALYVTNRERPRPAVQAFTRVVDTAVIEDLELMPGTLTLEDRHPAVLGDLLASQPLIAFGQYSGDLEESPVLVGRRGKEFVRIPVQVLPAETSGSMFDALWARAAVADLEPRLWVGHDPEAVAEITRLGLKHRIVTPFTSLIAVDRTRQIGDGFPRDIGMPTTAPEGIDPWMAGGDPYGQAEQRYTVQGANVNSPSFGTVGATRVQAVATSIRDSGGMASRPGRPERGFVAAPSTTTDFFAMDMGHGPTIARSKGLVPRLVIGRPRGSTDVPARSFLQAVRGVRTDLKHCWGAGRSPGARRRVQIVLTWSRDRTPRIEVMNHDAAPDHDACLIEVLESVEWPQPSPGTKVSIPLHFFTS